jgi:hypothetical protein
VFLNTVVVSVSVYGGHHPVAAAVGALATLLTVVLQVARPNAATSKEAITSKDVSWTFTVRRTEKAL